MANIIAKWYPLGSEFTYDVWYSDHEDGPWVKHNLVRLDDSYFSESGYTLYNQYTISGLDPNKVYYVRITCIDKYDAWWVGYESYNSVTGGYGHEEDPIEEPLNNAIGLKIVVG